MYLCSLLQNITLKVWNNVIKKLVSKSLNKRKGKKKNPFECTVIGHLSSTALLLLFIIDRRVS